MAQNDIIVFDRAAVRAHRTRAAAHFAAHDFLFREVAQRLVDRLADISRTFPVALDLGARPGVLADALQAEGVAQSRGIATLIEAAPVESFARAPLGLVADEEMLPIAPASCDLVLSNLSLHWVNDLPGALLQIRQSLKPDGLFLGAMLGGDTLPELRASLAEAEMAVEGGLSPRVSPFADVRDLGGLLQRAGFALPVTDADTIRVTYADAFGLLRDLRGMGETNAVVERRRTPLRRATLMRAAEIYQARFAGKDGRIPATFQVVTLTGWAPHESQQKPLRPGSAKTRLADALGATEIAAGDKTGSKPPTRA
jgi:NADH dehydrogenase [ubiquinone] 1 alpha subcomplex assembly factor 5